MNGWKDLTDVEVTAESIKMFEAHCSELLIHAADVEGLCQGVDEELVTRKYSVGHTDIRSRGMGNITLHVRWWSQG